MELVISIAEITDAPALTTLGIITFVDTFAKDNRKEDMDKYVAEEMNVEKITAELADKKNLFFLARYEGTLAGYAKLRTGKNPIAVPGNKPLELERIYVLKEYQGLKIGAALFNLCLTHGVTNGFDTMWLGVWQHNHTAINFYKQRGFEFFGSHHFRLGDDLQTDELMMKKLGKI